MGLIAGGEAGKRAATTVGLRCSADTLLRRLIIPWRRNCQARPMSVLMSGVASGPLLRYVNSQSWYSPSPRPVARSRSAYAGDLVQKISGNTGCLAWSQWSLCNSSTWRCTSGQTGGRSMAPAKKYWRCAWTKDVQTYDSDTSCYQLVVTKGITRGKTICACSIAPSSGTP